MNPKSKTLMMLLLLFAILFDVSISEAPNTTRKPIKSTTDIANGASSVAFKITGNVYPIGYYSVSLTIGNPPRLYDLDIDTGSDLTWVQCDAPCTGCTRPRNRLYKPIPNNLIACSHEYCIHVHLPKKPECADASDQCDYEVEYADSGSSLGVLVKDKLSLNLINGTSVAPDLAFGCGYDQSYQGSHNPPDTAGVLGLGKGNVSIVSQLHSLGAAKNVIGHCLSGKTGGYLFFGGDFVPSSGLVWTPMLSNKLKKHYWAGPAELLFGRKTTNVKGLQVIFDSGSSYTYLNTQAYETVVDLLRKNLAASLKDVMDPAFPICWKGEKHFKSIQDVKSYFKMFVLSFTKSKNVKLEMPPESYLVVTELGNVCLGILSGKEAGLENVNLIGDISMVNKLVVYDNKKSQIGWAAADCTRVPNMDRDYNEVFSGNYAAKFGTFEDNCPASYAF